jgi:hypothetical protein
VLQLGKRRGSRSLQKTDQIVHCGLQRRQCCITPTLHQTARSKSARVWDLTHLVVNNSPKLRDYKALLTCTALQTVSLINNSMKTLEALVNCTKLTSLNLRYCKQLIDISGLLNCTAIERLYMDYCLSLTNLNGLQDHSALTRLKLSMCKSLTNVDALSTCSSLRYLDVRHCDILLDLGVVKTCMTSNNVTVDCYGFAELIPSYKQSMPNICNIMT